MARIHHAAPLQPLASAGRRSGCFGSKPNFCLEFVSILARCCPLLDLLCKRLRLVWFGLSGYCFRNGDTPQPNLLEAWSILLVESLYLLRGRLCIRLHPLLSTLRKQPQALELKVFLKSWVFVDT